MDDNNDFSTFSTADFRVRLETLMKNGGYWTSRGPDYAALAPRLNMTAVTLFRYLRDDKREPKVSYIMSIATFFDVSTDWLLGLTDSPEKTSPADNEAKILTPQGELDKLAILYSKASLNDKEIVKCVLSKYEDAPEG